ncbi:acetylornithine transaminase [Desulfurispora thermophila]|uniref:acetylornithine transaminase n=1 Tax=Desulfurispora thermophila TaxID=265470 RepID=UPI00036D29DB|nr:acetylornithine transaminase [Desulfurispora thermophila]
MNSAEIIALSDQYILPTYGRLPFCPVRGEGALLYDAEGRAYLDFVAGLAVNALGHAHPAVTKAICEQAGQLMHVSNLYYIEPQARLAAALVQNSCASKVFFCNSGAEANEAAIKLARKYGKQNGASKYEIITALQSFHGRTLAAITATGQPKYQRGFEPLPEGFTYVPFNDLDALAAAITPRTCAVMLEPVQGEGGVYPADPQYLQGVRRICDEHGLLLIFDEVQCGLGRTGQLFAYQHYGVEPDVLTLAKALGNGFPIGAMLVGPKAVGVLQPGDHASTFGGNPLACRVALAVLEQLLAGGVVDNAARVGRYFYQRLQELQAKYPFVRQVRGLGLMLGLELEREGRPVVDACRARGLLINCVGTNILRFVPPLIISEADVDRALEILEQVFCSFS